MIPYIRAEGRDNIINCNSDLVILDNRSLILVSLVDYAIKTKKVCADLISGHGVTLKDRENVNYGEYIWTNNEKYRFKSDKQGDLTHTIIYNANKLKNYAINWSNEDFTTLITNYLRSRYYLPITKEIVNLVIAQDKKKCEESKYHESIFKQCKVHTNNPMLKDLICYYVSKESFIYELNQLNLIAEDNFDWNVIEDIEDYLYTFAKPIKNKLNEKVKILYNPNKINPYIFEGKYKPFDGQIPIIQGGIEVLKRDRFLYLAAQQGFGKTTCGTKINHCYFKEKDKKNYCTLIIAPAITLTQWKEEIENSIGDKVNIKIIKKTDEFIRWYNKEYHNITKPTYIIIGKETFKLTYAKKPAVLYKTREIKHKVKDDYWYSRTRSDLAYKTISEKIEVAICPTCGKPLMNPNLKNEDKYFNRDDFKGNPKKSNYKCQYCNSILWEASYDKTKKTSIIDFIKRKKIIFDSIIQDEIHQSNNSGSIIGNASRTVMQYTKKNILLSGTTNNGYASNLHNLFIGLLPKKLQDNNVMDIKDFIRNYGTLQAINKKKDGEYYSRGRSEIKDSDFKEIEGINPLVFTSYMIQNYIFATLDDLGKDLPPFNEYYIPIKQDNNISYAENKLFNDIKKGNSFNAKMYIDSIIKHYVNNPFSWKEITVESKDKKEIVQPKNFESNTILFKEKTVIDLVSKEVSENRKAWIYCDFNNGGEYMTGESLPNRLQRMLKDKGLKVYQLKPSVKTYDRKEIIDKNKDKYDVFISNMKLVEVGVNLTFCPSYIFYMPSYFVNSVAQASRRGMRANSVLENRIYHLYYENSCENEIIKRYQRKMAESKAIIGQFDVNLEDESNIRTASKMAKNINDNL